MWVCPSCARTFGRRGQGHECAPALSVEEYFATGPTHERAVFEAVREHLESLGEVVIEPLSAGIVFKRRRIFAWLIPRNRWVNLHVALPRRVEHPRIARAEPSPSGATVYHRIRIDGPGDVDATVRSWLSEAWDANP